ncbi:30S ribosomal protein S2 [bacterium]|nr:30S ribosomal protein S2 [bacterium]
MPETKIDEKTVLELANAGVIYGHKKSKTHPKMKPFIGANRNEIELLKPESVINSLQKAIEFLKEKQSRKALILVVGTHPSAHGSIEKLAETFSFPLVTTRWLGGTITNFTVIHERVKEYLDLKSKKEKGELSKYTKKEQLDFTKKLKKMKEKFEGLVRLTKVPDVLFTVDPKEHETAIREAKIKNIPVIALADTDDNPQEIDYPIIANDHAKSSIDWIVDKITEALESAKVEEVTKKPAKEQKSKKENSTASQAKRE